MIETNDILRLLADGQFHSGEELAQVMGVSRTAVWKHLKKLEAQGLELYSTRGKGYRLDEPLELLDGGAIKACLVPEVVPLLSELELLHSVDSTNQHVMDKAAQGTPSGYVSLAERQTAGKGRRGRTWVSPFGRNLYLSLLWRFTGGAGAMEGLSLAVGVGVIRALEALGVNDVQLKWPNDILYKRQKLGGVLIEMTGDVAGHCQAVVGLGLNVSMPENLAEAIDQSWTDLESIAGNTPTRNALAAACINELLPLLNQYETSGFSPYKADWELKDAFCGQQVQLVMGDRSITGIATGIDEAGGIRIQGDTGTQTYYGGEISLRALL